MSFIFFISYWVLWTLTLILAGMVIYLYKRIEDSKNKRRMLAESNSGLSKGVMYPVTKVYDIDNKEIIINSSYKSTILLFTSAHCDVCKRIYPILEMVKQKYPSINIVIMMLATHEEAKNIRSRFNIKISPISLIKDEELFPLGIPGFPFCYLLTPDGKVVEKGIVNKIDHFDILLSKVIKVS